MIRTAISAAAAAALPFAASAQNVEPDAAAAAPRIVTEERMVELEASQNESQSGIARHALAVTGASDSSTVSLTVSQAEKALTRNGLRFGSITLKAPLASAGDEGTFITEQGISNKASLEGSYTWILTDLSFDRMRGVRGLIVPFVQACNQKAETNPEYLSLQGNSQVSLEQAQITFREKACKPYRNFLKLSKDEIAQMTPEQAAGLRAIQARLDARPIHIINIAASFGYKKFDYLNLADFAEQKAKRTPVSVSASWGVNPGKGKPFWGVGYQHKRDYKEPDKQVVCPVAAAGATQVQCKNAVFGPPKRDVDHTLFGLVRTADLFGQIKRKPGQWSPMLEIKVGYDFEDKAFSVSAPFYFFLDKDKSFKGGLRVSWQEAGKDETEDKLKAAFFIVKTFDYFGL